MRRWDCPAAAGYLETLSCPVEGQLGICMARIESAAGNSETTLLVYEDAAVRERGVMSPRRG
jgi:hypothetical protein